MALLVVLLITSMAAMVWAASPINVDSDGLALRGYDPVAYFTQGEPVPGSRVFVSQWNGATWRFSSQEHLKLFSKDPEKYAPRYGGY
jgi:YHS domain-containing protein